MPLIKLPKALQPIKDILNVTVRKTAEFLSSILDRVASGPDIFYKKNGPFKGPQDYDDPFGK